MFAPLLLMLVGAAVLFLIALLLLGVPRRGAGYPRNGVELRGSARKHL